MKQNPTNAAATKPQPAVTPVVQSELNFDQFVI